MAGGTRVLQVDELRVDPESREVALDGARIELSPKEFARLRTLAAEPTRVFTKEELLRDIWGFQLMGTSRHSPVKLRYRRSGGPPEARATLA